MKSGDRQAGRNVWGANWVWKGARGVRAMRWRGSRDMESESVGLLGCAGLDWAGRAGLPWLAGERAIVCSRRRVCGERSPLLLRSAFVC